MSATQSMVTYTYCMLAIDTANIGYQLCNLHGHIYILYASYRH